MIFEEKLLAKGEEFLTHSVISKQNERDILKYYLNKIKPRVIVEIGTFRGATTAFLSRYAHKVYSFDIKDHLGRHCLWEEFKIKNIEFFKIDNEKEKKNIIDSLRFDFAFVDGMHRTPFPENDFCMVKHCKRVLFHDYRDTWHYDGVKEIVNKLECEIKEPFAYWEAKT